LLEEKWDLDSQTLIPNIRDPFLHDWSCAGTRLAAADHPIDLLEFQFPKRTEQWLKRLEFDILSFGCKIKQSHFLGANMIIIPVSIIDKLLGVVFDFVKTGGESLVKNIATKKSIRKAIEHASERFGNEYDDVELANALVVDTKFYDLPSVQRAIREMLEHPFDPAPQIRIENEFAEVLPDSKKNLADQAAWSYFEILREELIGVEKLNDKLKLIYLKRTTAATERTANGVEKILSRYNVSQTEIEKAKEKYLQYLIDINTYIDPRGIMQTRRSVALKLDDVYISLTAEIEGMQDTSLLAAKDRSLQFSENLEIKGASDVDKKGEIIIETVLDKKSEAIVETVDFPKAVRENKHLVILGDPGRVRLL